MNRKNRTGNTIHYLQATHFGNVRITAKGKVAKFGRNQKEMKYAKRRNCDNTKPQQRNIL